MTDPGALLAAHPYLFSNLISLAGVLTARQFLPRTELKKLLLGLGFLLVPASLLGVFVEESYWSPLRLWGWRIGVEDLLCTFDIGAGAFLPVLFLFGRRLVVPATAAPRISWLAAAALAGPVACLGLSYLGLSSVPMMALGHLLAAAGLLVLRRDWWLVSLSNAAAFTLLYLSVVRAYFWIWPGFTVNWNAATVWGRPFLGMPLGEIVWAATFGLVWPLFASVVFDIRLAARAPSQRTASAAVPR